MTSTHVTPAELMPEKPAAVDTGAMHGPALDGVTAAYAALVAFCADLDTPANSVAWLAEYDRLNAAYQQACARPPAAVDTGRAHGPNTWIVSPSTGVVVRVGDRYTNDSFYDGATAEVIAIDGWQLTYRVTYAEGHGEPRAWTTHAYSFLASYVAPRHARKIEPTPAAIIDAAAQSLGRELTTRDACALFA